MDEYIIIYALIVVFLGGGSVLLLAFGWLMFKVSVASQQDKQQLDKEGISAEAEILDKRAVDGRKRIMYFITCRFTATASDGTTKPITFEEEIQGGEYNGLKAGDHINVRYLADKPTVREIVSGARSVFTPTRWRINAIILIVVGVFLAVFMVFMLGSTANTKARAEATNTAFALFMHATPNEDQRTATIHAAFVTLEVDTAAVGNLRQVLADNLPEWEKVTDRVMHRIALPSSELKITGVEIDYGYCETGHFYAYIWLKLTENLRVGNDVTSYFDGYGYVQESQPQDCYPRELSQVWLRNSGSLGGNWYAVSGATEQRLPTATPRS